MTKSNVFDPKSKIPANVSVCVSGRELEGLGKDSNPPRKSPAGDLTRKTGQILTLTDRRAQ